MIVEDWIAEVEDGRFGEEAICVVVGGESVKVLCVIG